MIVQSHTRVFPSTIGQTTVVVLGLGALGLLGVTGMAMVKKDQDIVAKHVMFRAARDSAQYQLDHDGACPPPVTTHPSSVDFWREPFVVECPGKHRRGEADIVSKGRDKIFGTADDIKSWDL